MKLVTDDCVFKLLYDSTLHYEDIRLNYKKSEKNIQKSEIVTPYIAYELKMESVRGNRELKVSLVDYTDSDCQILSVDISNIEKISSLPLNIERYLVEECNLIEANHLTRFNVSNEQELAENLNVYFKWLDQIKNPNLSKILRGDLWVDMPFDWHGYK